MRRRRSISHKITALLLGTILVAMLLNGAVSVGSLISMRRTSQESSQSLGRTAAQDAEHALETMAGEQLLTLSVEKAANIEEKFLTVESYAHGIAQAAERIYDSPQNYPERFVAEPERDSHELQAQLLYSERLAEPTQQQWEELSSLANIQDLLVQYNANNEMVGSSHITTTSGWVIQADNIPYTKYREDGSLEYLESAGRQWYQRALQAQPGQCVYSDVMQDIHGGGACIVCAQPVYHDGGIVAVAGVGYYLETVNRTVLETSVGGKGYAFLLNEKGQVIVSPMTEGETAVYEDRDADLRESDNAALARLAQDMTAGGSGVSRLDLDGREVYLAYAPLEGLDWSFVTVMAVEDVIAPAVESERQILALTREVAGRQNEAIRRTMIFFACMVFVVVLLLLPASVMMTRRLTEPIIRLTEDARRIGGGNLDYRIHITTGDEIEDLGNAFNDMTEQLQQYVDNLASVTAEKERIRTELTVAARLQSDMLPIAKGAFPERQEFTLAASMTPAKEVGGDFYDFYLLDEDHLALVVADVSGKGVPAALFMVIAKALLQTHLAKGASLEQEVEETNESLCANNKNGMFVTAWIGVLTISDGTLTYVNAGHCRPLLRRRDGKFAYLAERGGFVLAGMEGMKFRQTTVVMEPGDVLYQCSDGVTEANDEQGRLYGEERLERLLNETRTGEPEEILTRVWEDIQVFAGDAEQFDDITMLSLRYNGREKAKEVFRGKADIDDMPKVLETIENWLTEVAADKESRAKILVAVDELFSNICIHSGAQEAQILCSAKDACVRLVFRDDGVPYNPLKRADPDVTLSAEERRIGGLGIYLVKKTMDELSYEYINGKNCLTIIKNIEGGVHSGSEKI